MKDLFQHGPIAAAVMITLLLLSIFSWAIVFAKWRELRAGRDRNRGFLRGFRQSPSLVDAVGVSQMHQQAPLNAVFAFGYNEVDRQVKQRGTLINRAALERSLQLGVSEEIARLEAQRR